MTNEPGLPINPSGGEPWCIDCNTIPDFSKIVMHERHNRRYQSGQFKRIDQPPEFAVNRAMRRAKKKYIAKLPKSMQEVIMNGILTRNLLAQIEFLNMPVGEWHLGYIKHD